MSNKYDEAAEQICVTPEMRQRILDNLESEKKPSLPQQRSRKQPIKRIISIAACFVILFSCAAVLPLLSNQENPGLQNSAPGIPGSSPGMQNGSPSTYYDTLAGLSSSLDFPLLVPSFLPDGYELIDSETLPGEVAQLEYSNGTDTIIFRTAPAQGDISGDYTDYSQTETASVGEYAVTLKGEAHLFTTIVCTSASNSSSFFLTKPVDRNEATRLVEGIKPFQAD